MSGNDWVKVEGDLAVEAIRMATEYAPATVERLDGQISAIVLNGGNPVRLVGNWSASGRIDVYVPNKKKRTVYEVTGSVKLGDHEIPLKLQFDDRNKADSVAFDLLYSRIETLEILEPA